MADLDDQLNKHIDEALAMEQNVLRMLDGMISTTEDEEIRSELRHHKLETEQHAERLEKRLAAHEASPSTVRGSACCGSRGSGTRRRRWSIARLRAMVSTHVSSPARRAS